MRYDRKTGGMTFHVVHSKEAKPMEFSAIDTELAFETIRMGDAPRKAEEIQSFLADCDLKIDGGVEFFFLARNRHGRIVGCAGTDTNVIKCVAISEDYRGENLALVLVSEAVKIAMDNGYFHLFLYTKPENTDFFKSCGFYPLVEVPDYVTLMEDTPIGIEHYCRKLRKLRHAGETIGGIVVNANPFTYGHRYLVEQAAAACDWLFVFVVSEDASMFSYKDRLFLVRQGLADLENVTVLEGSDYMVSKATFPSYFLKESGTVAHARTAVDLLLFRQYIAPALGITHRFVGTEPFCQVTSKYNDDMWYWLRVAPNPAPPITVVEVPRIPSSHGVAISASEVRALIKSKNFDRLKNLVPQATEDLILSKYRDRAA
jgi:[citrate (pro-3S)-lyase] ligase